MKAKIISNKGVDEGTVSHCFAIGSIVDVDPDCDGIEWYNAFGIHPKTKQKVFQLLEKHEFKFIE